MLRNLNRTYSRGRICGTPHSGVLGSLIPSSGDDGAGYAYSSLDLPADNNNEYQGYITSVPAGLTLFAYEDTSFTASANDGIYEVPWELYENGVLLGSTTFTLTFGEAGTIISCTVGNVVANGSTANIAINVTVATSVGDCIASGVTANVANDTSVTGITGNATANGSTATINQEVRISCSIGDGVANGVVANVAITYIPSTARLVRVAREDRYVRVKAENRIVKA